MNMTKQQICDLDMPVNLRDFYINCCGECDTLKQVFIETQKSGQLRWTQWLFEQVLDRSELVKLSIFAVRQLLPLFADKYPDDELPQGVLDATVKYLDNTATKENSDWVYDQASQCWSLGAKLVKQYYRSGVSNAVHDSWDDKLPMAYGYAVLAAGGLYNDIFNGHDSLPDVYGVFDYLPLDTVQPILLDMIEYGMQMVDNCNDTEAPNEPAQKHEVYAAVASMKDVERRMKALDGRMDNQLRTHLLAYANDLSETIEIMIKQP